MSGSQAEVMRICRLLEALFVFSRVQPHEAASRLGTTTGTLRRILTGAQELKLRHILDILEALGISPVTFFRLAYESEPGARHSRSPTEDAEAILLTASKIRQAQQTFSRQDLQEILEATLRRLAQPPGDPALAAPERTKY